MSQLAIQKESEQTPPPAQQSIEACKSLFNGSATRKQLEAMWRGFSPRFRGMILIAGDMKASEHVREFNSFDDLEMRKIHVGMQQLKEIVIQLDRNVGDVRRLKHHHFSSTH
ncbi:hypothetical protein [Vibrio nigripulchritudo]|uniref:hypothetical protein n=1 Tax=Vibrio nigripulchritudo TaxID=28173 RepID=UPI0024914747|nr:hypothetical protein [Vibrio nigripulchritudo]BDU38725.1 hypothetical protein TUMSATVNIG2_31940 [Vibrio nigripulchritudo]BDU44445.1 hypothetical protein TUMSATVNIG3_32430 [Vibrio nigripulchritudo]